MIPLNNDKNTEDSDSPKKKYVIPLNSSQSNEEKSLEDSKSIELKQKVKKAISRIHSTYQENIKPLLDEKKMNKRIDLFDLAESRYQIIKNLERTISDLESLEKEFSPLPDFGLNGLGKNSLTNLLQKVREYDWSDPNTLELFNIEYAEKIHRPF